MADIEMPIEDLLKKMVDSCTQSAVSLHDSMVANPDKLPNRYVIPKMSVELKVEMSLSENKVKGVINKKKSEHAASSMSTIRLDIVAIPHAAQEAQGQ